MDTVMMLLVAVIGSSGLSTIIVSCLNRKWTKQDKKDDRLDALVNAQKVVMIDRVTHLGHTYIKAGELTLAQKDNLTDMHKAYQRLGGNGHLDLIMSEVNKLKVV